MDVPLYDVLPEIVFVFAEMIFSPGAKMSTHVPKLESSARESSSAVEPTVIALSAEAGECEQAVVFEFPPATTMTTPAATAAFTASLRDLITPGALRLKFATAPFGRDCPTTQSIPARTVAKVPYPETSKTLTAIKFAFFAIPYSRPPTVPGKGKEGKISE
jgi:hypothetical protein